MANLLNIDATANPDLVGDAATPTLTLRNTSTGAALLAAIIENDSTTAGVLVRRSVVGNLSIGVLRVQGSSIASGAVLEFTNKGFASITSVVLTTVANTDYAIRVQVGLETRWIPLFKDAAVIGAAAFT